MRKLTKSDITFMIVMTFFAIVSFSRFFDEKIKKHIVLFDFMQDYEYAMFFTVVYFVILLLFFTVCIIYCEKKYRKDIYYLICFYATFAFPMFLSSRYFGAVDIYAWMLTWIASMCLISNRVEGLTIILCYLMSFISPMSVFTGVCIVVVILAYKFLTMKDKKYWYYLIGCLVTSSIGLYMSCQLGTFSTDEQAILSMDRFVILVLFLCPYMYIAANFFLELLRKTSSVKRWGYVLLLIGILPSAVVYIGLEDYARVFFYTFSYVILIVMVYVAKNDWDVIWQLQRTKDIIKSWVPIPVLVIVIPFLFMTLWIAGQQHLMKEVFINK